MTMDDLQEKITNLEYRNHQLRRANSRLKDSERNLKRIIRELKETAAKESPKKHKYRNKNHQGYSKR